MNPKKVKEKERRRARKQADQAWEAADNENLDLAEKIIRRAVATQPENPVLWNDQGMLLRQKGKDVEAEEAFRTAIAPAPTYAEPYAQLAAIRIKQGTVEDAVRLMEKAVKTAPAMVAHIERLEAYRALVVRPTAPVEKQAPQAVAAKPAPLTSAIGDPALAQTLAAVAWQDLDQRLTRDGCVLIPALLAPATCAELRSYFDDDSLFAKTVVMDRPDFGQGAYRYFRAPIPPTVDLAARQMYPHVARIANEWRRLLNEVDRFPDDWESFREQCRAAGQTTPTPILLKYGPGGFNALHRDLRGSVFFPIQMAVILSQHAEAAELASDGFRGGEFQFCDVPERKKSRRREVAAGLGDALLFCTRDRLVQIGGAYGLQPVKHGVNRITHGTRLVLGVPFHEYR